MPDTNVVPLGRDGKPLVFVKSGTVYTDSRILAATSGKRHDHILRDIRNLAENLTPQNWGMLFTAVFEPHPTVPGRQIEFFEMTRAGFMLLGMGFTGREWTEWKLKLIYAFDYMEAQLRERNEADVAAVFNDPSRLRAALADYAERVEVLEEHVAVLEPKGQAYDEIAASDNDMNITRAAKAINAKPHDLFKWMRDHKWIYRSDGNTPYQSKIDAGLMLLKIGQVQHGPNKGLRVEQARVTWKGLLQLAREYHADRPQVLWPLLERLEKEMKLKLKKAS